jgi:hypothetical protein
MPKEYWYFLKGQTNVKNDMIIDLKHVRYWTTEESSTNLAVYYLKLKWDVRVLIIIYKVC